MARYGGLTGAPDESGSRRREKGLARAGNARIRRGMIELAWRFLMFQKDSHLAQWYWRRTVDARGATRKTMIVALARKLLVSLCAGNHRRGSRGCRAAAGAVNNWPAAHH